MTNLVFQGQRIKAANPPSDHVTAKSDLSERLILGSKIIALQRVPAGPGCINRVKSSGTTGLVANLDAIENTSSFIP